jgi:pyruvate dehydrogenase E2 component (dihydrolipoamide acetyltransferase)
VTDQLDEARIILPKYGMTMTDGFIVRWLRDIGDVVTAGEALVEVETDKVTMQLEAPAAGVLFTPVRKFR